MQGVDPKTQQLLTKFVIALVVYFLLRNSIRDFTQQNAKDNVLNDPNSYVAFQIRQAVQPWGSDWTGGIDGTDTEELFRLAAQIKNLDAVKSSYRTQFGEDMLERLRKEFNDNQRFTAWVQAIGTGNTGTTKPTRVIAKVQTPVLSATEPVTTTNVAKTVTAGAEVGKYLLEKIIVWKSGKKEAYVLAEWSVYFGLSTERGWVPKANVTLV